MQQKRVAIVGSGCSGIGALWALKQSGHDVHLYEAGSRLGGHTNTVQWEHDGQEVNVDTGFIVFNSATYPNFIRFLDTVGVNTVATDMTFGVSRDQGSFEWSGTSLRSIFAQTGNIFSLKMWRMIFDIIRFNQFALDLLETEDESQVDVSGINGVTEKPEKPKEQESIGQYLRRNGYSDSFRDDYLIPMAAAVWSTSPDKTALHFPAVTMIRFLWNHHLLSTFAARPTWRTIPGGSQQYIDAVLKDFPPSNIHLDREVVGVEDINAKVILQFEEDEELFDHVILACHGAQAMNIIKDSGTEEERLILGGFETSPNVAYLHSDLSLMPQRESTWSSWNYMTESSPTSANIDKVCLTYNMNILQHIPRAVYSDVLVTLNPLHIPDPAKVQGRWDYAHPLYSPEAIRSQKMLPRIQNTRGISYAGAWTKYGFHEDGFSSGIKVAIEHLGATLPWEFVDSTFSRGKRPVKTVSDRFARLIIWYFSFVFWLLEGLLAILLWPLGFDSTKRSKVE